jgi:succinate dehydrogenase hydrophobic anchor subunit
MSDLNKNRQVKTLIRLLSYFTGLLVILYIISQFFYHFEVEDILRENKTLEWLECLWLCISSLLLFLAARRTTKFPKLFAAFWLLPLIAVFRELDGELDKMLFHDSWVIPAATVSILVIYRISKSYETIKVESLLFMQTQQMIFLGTGFFIVAVFAQLCGQQSMWQVIMEEHYQRNIGRFLEEILEFLGYIILMVGSLECLLQD